MGRKNFDDMYFDGELEIGDSFCKETQQVYKRKCYDLWDELGKSYPDDGWVEDYSDGTYLKLMRGEVK